MEISKHTINQVSDNSLYNTLGIRIEHAADGEARARLEPSPEVCWPFSGQPHGGILFTLMDTTMAWAVLSQRESGQNCTTINLNIHYTQPATGKFFNCTAWVTHQTERSSFLSADIHDEQGRLLAMGQATFRIIRAKFL
ncbi:MAG: PaaI family thioesterase [Desulfobacterales bacterium]